MKLTKAQPDRAVECKLFERDDCNALMQAVRNAAAIDAAQRAEKSTNQVDDYLEQTSATTLVVELIDELKRLGYEIAPKAKVAAPLEISYTGDYPGRPYMQGEERLVTEPQQRALLELFGINNLRTLLDKLEVPMFSPTSQEHKRWAGELCLKTKKIGSTS